MKEKPEHVMVYKRRGVTDENGEQYLMYNGGARIKNLLNAGKQPKIPRNCKRGDALAAMVKFAPDVKVLHRSSDRDEAEERASVRWHISPPCPKDGNAQTRIKSYKDIYDGPMRGLMQCAGEDYPILSVSRLGDFGDRQVALLHAEDKSGAYRDWLLPSMRVIGESKDTRAIKKTSDFVRRSRRFISIILRQLYQHEKDKKDFETDRAKYDSRRWYPLYSDPELGDAECSGIHRDPDGEHVYVFVVRDFVGYGIDNFWDLVVRLPEGEITEVSVDDPENFDLDSLRIDRVGRILQRLANDADAIFELARTGADPACTTDDMNRIRNKIGGKIYRWMVDQCPYCGDDLWDERIHYDVRVPVRFRMQGGDFKILKTEIYHRVAEAVGKGTATGVCEHCGHELTSEDINRAKEGWQYPLRPDVTGKLH